MNDSFLTAKARLDRPSVGASCSSRIGTRTALLTGEGDEHLMLAVGAANSSKPFLQIAALEKGCHRLLDDGPPKRVRVRDAAARRQSPGVRKDGQTDLRDDCQRTNKEKMAKINIKVSHLEYFETPKSRSVVYASD